MSGPRRLTPEKIARMLAAFEPATITPYPFSGRNSRNINENKGENMFRPKNHGVGTVGTGPGAAVAVPTVPARGIWQSEHPIYEKTEPFQGQDTAVPTVPTVPTEKQVGGACRPAEWWRDLFEERAAVLEHDHGHPRPKAERLAFEGCVSEWLNENPPPLDPDRCVCCGEPLPADGGDAVPVPRGVDATTHVWVRRAHYERWLRRRRAEVVAALAAAGVIDP